MLFPRWRARSTLRREAQFGGLLFYASLEMNSDVYQPPKSRSPRGWGGLKAARYLALTSFPVFTAATFFESKVLDNLFVFSGGLLFAGGVVSAASFVCPACERPFLRLRIIDYFFSVWIFKILVAPTCVSCGAAERDELPTP